jgi:hypothetical protein
MDSDQLARRYATLTARERLPLLLAARVRGDDVEAERLLESAPRELWRVPHHQTLAEALCDLSLLHVALLLDAAAQLWHADGLLETNDRFAKKGRAREARELRLLATMRRLGTRILALQEGWRRFCAGLHIDPEAPLRDLPGYGTVQLAVRAAPLMALSAEEMAALAALPGGNPELTPEAVYADYLATLEYREGGGSSD